MNNRAKGRRYEDIAAAFLRHSGYTILERNFRTRRGEIDIIAMDGGYICFVEVKFRSSDAYGFPSEAVDRKKQLKIIAASDYYLSVHGMMASARRYDVVEIIGGRIRILKNSFGG